MILFMLYDYRADPETQERYEQLHLYIFVIFVIEAILKLLCMGWIYFKNYWNVFS